MDWMWGEGKEKDQGMNQVFSLRNGMQPIQLTWAE